MHDAVMERVGDCNIFISAAAVADYRVDEPATQKVKKQQEELTLQLVPNADVLAEVAALENGPFTVGFAAETENLEAHAREKLQNKKLDMIAANLVGEGKGFDQEENALLVLSAPKSSASKQFAAELVELPQTSKEKLARQLIGLVAKNH